MIIRKILKRTRVMCTIKDINYEKLRELLKNECNVILIDARSPQEFLEGRIEGSINVPWYDISKRASLLFPNKNSHIIVYCQSGERSKKACKVLEKLGYVNLYDLIGGLDNIS